MRFPRILAIAGLLLAVSCEVPPARPEIPPVSVQIPDPTAECPAPTMTVLVIGDSIAKGMADVLTNPCTTIVNAAISGTSPAPGGNPKETVPDVNWPVYLPTLLDEYKPDVVVMHWLPNAPHILEAVRSGVESLVAQSAAAGARVILAVPPAPVAAWFCNFDDPITIFLAEWADEVRSGAFGVQLVDWSGIRPGGDCIHLTADGSAEAAGLTAAAIGLPPGYVPPVTTTTTAPEPEPEPTTTTTTTTTTTG